MILFTVLLFSSVLSSTAAASTSFLMNTKKIYTYSIYDEKNKHNRSSMTANFTGKINDSNLWYYKVGGGLFFQQLYLQDNEGLHATYTELQFPLAKGTEWTKGDGTTARIVSLNNNVKTQAGTFSNCVLVETKLGNSKNTFYYAPGHGMVKFRGDDGIIIELTKIQNAHYGRVLIKQAGIKLYNPNGKVHQTLKRGEGLKVFKENANSYDVGGGYYVKKSKDTLFYTGFIYSTEKQMDIYSPNGKVHRKAPSGETIRVYGFENGKYQVGGGYYIFVNDHIQYDR